MKLEQLNPPRKFLARGKGVDVEISDCAHIELAPDEQVTFITENGGEYDVVRKDWGFYATPSVNSRLKSFGFWTALVLNAQEKLFVMLVAEDSQELFFEYLDSDHLSLLCWLDEKETIERLRSDFAP